MNDVERFWKAVDRRGERECWPWLRARAGGRDGKTYGLFSRSRQKAGRRNVYAHRMAFCLANDIDPGTFPGSVVVRHSCDNPVCCNPKHLDGGTQGDNAQDMVRRGRSRRGTRATGAALTESDVLTIRRLLDEGLLHRDIAARYGVSRPAISQIASGRNWAWLSEPLTRAAECVTVII